MGDRWQLADVVSETGVLPASMDADEIRRGDDDDERLRSGPRSGGGRERRGRCELPVVVRMAMASARLARRRSGSRWGGALNWAHRHSTDVGALNTIHYTLSEE